MGHQVYKSGPNIMPLVNERQDGKMAAVRKKVADDFIPWTSRENLFRP